MKAALSFDRSGSAVGVCGLNPDVTIVFRAGRVPHIETVLQAVAGIAYLEISKGPQALYGCISLGTKKIETRFAWLAGSEDKMIDLAAEVSAAQGAPAAVRATNFQIAGEHGCKCSEIAFITPMRSAIGIGFIFDHRDIEHHNADDRATDPRLGSSGLAVWSQRSVSTHLQDRRCLSCMI